MFKVPSRSVEIITNEDIQLKEDGKVKVFVTDKLETIYFGSRSSDINLKIYDKAKELRSNNSNSKYLLMYSYLKENGLDTDTTEGWFYF